MKLGITGSVAFVDYEHFKRVLEAIPLPISLIVTGGQKGAEALARLYAKEQGISALLHHANKQTHGEEWLFRRNTLLVADADNVLVFSRVGTRTLGKMKAMCIKGGKRMNVVYLPEPNEATPHHIAARYGEAI